MTYVVLVSQGDYEPHEYVGVRPTLKRAKELADSHLRHSGNVPFTQGFTDWREYRGFITRECEDKLKWTADHVGVSHWTAIIIHEP